MYWQQVGGKQKRGGGTKRGKVDTIIDYIRRHGRAGKIHLIPAAKAYYPSLVFVKRASYRR